MNFYREPLSFLRRFFQVMRMALALVGRRAPSRPVRLRLFFERAGGAFLKLGQILSLRQDLLPEAYTAELLHLLSRVPETPWPAMRQVFFEEFSLEPEEAFAAFSPLPIASASIAQVYRATLKGGEEVAVKIARPGIAETFERDFLLVSVFFRLLGWFNFFDRTALAEALVEFIAWTRRELDFTIEAENAVTFGRHSAAHPRTVIPKIFPAWTKPRVLVFEYMENILSPDQLILISQAAEAETLAYYFCTDLMRQYLIDGFFHADPHPANLFFTLDHKLGYFDFGIMGQVGAERLWLQEIVSGLARQELLAVSQSVFRFARVSFQDEINLIKRRDPETFAYYEPVFEKIIEIMIDALRLKLEKTLKPLYEPRVLAARTPDSSTMIAKLILETREFGLCLPKEVATFFRMLVIAEMVAKRLTPSFDLIKAFNYFLEQFPRREAEMVEESRVAPESASSLTFEQLLEVKASEREQLGLAKEHLAELVSYYAEQYREVRELLKK